MRLLFNFDPNAEASAYQGELIHVPMIDFYHVSEVWHAQALLSLTSLTVADHVS